MPVTEAATSSSSHSVPRLVPAVTDPVPLVERSDPRQIIVAHDDRTSLEKHLDATGHTFDDPGRRLAATLRKRRLDVPSGTPKERKTIPTAMAARADLREAINEYDEFVAFMSERIPTGARPIQSKYFRNKQLEKRGQLLKYDKVDDSTRSTP